MIVNTNIVANKQDYPSFLSIYSKEHLTLSAYYSPVTVKQDDSKQFIFNNTAKSYFFIDRSESIDNIFNDYYDQWHNETKYLSSPIMFENKHYRNIILLGMSVVPSIIKKLKETPAHLFEALVEITGEDPVPENHWGDIEEMAQDWIKWWEK